jgi:hypothetical protein
MEMNIKNQLKGMNITKVKMSNGKTLGQNLQDEAERLRTCIQKRLEEYLDSHLPIEYDRTGGLRNSLQVDDFLNVRVVGNGLEIDLFFDDGAIHPSGDGIRTTVGTEWQGNGEEVNTAFLLNYGYEVKKDVWFKNIKNFGYREGAGFVEDGIADFNATNTLGIKITVKSNGYLV